MKKGLLILGIAAISINLVGNIVLGVKLSRVKEYQESTFVVTYNEYNRSTHAIGASTNDIENTIKEKSLKYVSEYSITVIDLYHKDGENIYKESAEQLTYHNTNVDIIKNIVAEVQQVYSWMNISY